MTVDPVALDVRRRGTVRMLHGEDLIEASDLSEENPAAVVWCDFVDSALVLGSRQSREIAAERRLKERGVELVTRRSGGGAVLMVPGDLIWIDIVARRRVLSEDVRVSMVAAGEWWVEALDAVGAIPARLDSRVGTDSPADFAGVSADAPAEVSVHDGGLEIGPWGELVCFAGLGPGEVVLNGRKLVGLSQRRTHLGVRISGAVHLRSLVGSTPQFLSGTMPASAPPEAAVISPVDVAGLTRALAAAVTRSLTSL